MSSISGFAGNTMRVSSSAAMAKLGILNWKANYPCPDNDNVF